MCLSDEILSLEALFVQWILGLFDSFGPFDYYTKWVICVLESIVSQSHSLTFLYTTIIFESNCLNISIWSV